MASSPLTRRAFVVAGGSVLAGTLLPGSRTFAQSAGVAEIRMVTQGDRVIFDPVGILLEPGSRIRWVLDSGVHTATAYHPDNGRPLRIPKDARPWDSDYLTEPGASFEAVLETEGVYDYFCRAHEAAGMVGRIVVGRPRGGPATRPPGDELPEAARRAFPAIEEIMVRKIVHAASA